MEVFFFHKMISYPSIKLLSIHPAILPKPKTNVLRESNAVFQVKLYPKKKYCWGITVLLAHVHCRVAMDVLQLLVI